MKSLFIVLSFVIFGPLNLYAGQVLMAERQVLLNIDISTASLRMSSAGYSSPTLKVLVPDLADVTFLDHRNEGEAAPCLATYDTLVLDDVVQGNPKIEQIPFTIKLYKSVVIDENENKCQVYMAETVEGKIRGFDFIHDRFQQIADRHVDDCR
ncbi:MAG: hypothetical protein KDD40_11920 [Bdellovibrionales bacterium]|nr:hypothetical protein [Bdellovibrionales bacterium]